MKILFTKKIDENYAAEKLGNDVVADCVEVIKTHPITVIPFNLKNYSLIFTSVNGVASFFKNKFKPNEDFVQKNYNKIYCVGEKTKRELRKNGFGTFKVLQNADALKKFIVEKCPYEKFIHFCGNLALDVLDNNCPLQNINYKKIPIYRTQEINPVITEKYHAAVFFSPSGVRSFAKQNSFDEMKVFSIGETTTRELKKYTQNKIYTSSENTLKSVLEMIKKNI